MRQPSAVQVSLYVAEGILAVVVTSIVAAWREGSFPGHLVRDSRIPECAQSKERGPGRRVGCRLPDQVLGILWFYRRLSRVVYEDEGSQEQQRIPVASAQAETALRVALAEESPLGVSDSRDRPALCPKGVRQDAADATVPPPNLGGSRESESVESVSCILTASP